MSVLHEGKQVSKRRRKGFTYAEDVRSVGLVHLVWNITVVVTLKGSFCCSSPEDGAPLI